MRRKASYRFWGVLVVAVLLAWWAMAPAPQKTPITSTPRLACQDQAPQVGARLGLRFLRGASVRDVELETIERGLREHLESVGIAVDVFDGVDVSESELFAGAAKRTAGQTQAQLLAPLTDFLRLHDAEVAGVDVQVVVLRRILAASSPLRAELGALAGLAFASESHAQLAAQRARPNESGSTVPPLLGRTDWSVETGVVFLSLWDLERTAGAASTPSHEVGHALGLAHVENRPENLMAAQRSPRCKPVLNAQQAAFLARLLPADPLRSR